ncbi:hypothetical protein ACEWY4_027149 [Coilia grayii]|uniref:Uncharacterized protein n=1 Tax=Coilia grayii TaxID=363190 RepID=A0ABD1IRL7_9TELE
MIRQILDWLATPSYPTYGSGLFTDVWNPRRSPPRRPIFQRSLFSVDHPTGGYGSTPTVTLDGQTFTFKTGRWVGDASNAANPTSITRGSSKKRPGSGADSKICSLKKEVCSLEEENNVLKLRHELMFDMLAEITTEACALQQALEDTEKALAKKVKKRQEISK